MKKEGAFAEESEPKLHADCTTKTERYRLAEKTLSGQRQAVWRIEATEEGRLAGQMEKCRKLKVQGCNKVKVERGGTTPLL